MKNENPKETIARLELLYGYGPNWNYGGIGASPLGHYILSVKGSDFLYNVLLRIQYGKAVPESGHREKAQLIKTWSEEIVPQWRTFHFQVLKRIVPIYFLQTVLSLIVCYSFGLFFPSLIEPMLNPMASTVEGQELQLSFAVVGGMSVVVVGIIVLLIINMTLARIVREKVIEHLSKNI